MFKNIDKKYLNLIKVYIFVRKSDIRPLQIIFQRWSTNVKLLLTAIILRTVMTKKVVLEMEKSGNAGHAMMRMGAARVVEWDAVLRSPETVI